VYWLLPGQRAKLVMLLVASVLFYAYGEPAGVPILATVTAIAFAGGLAIRRWRRRAALVVGVATSLLLLQLGVFKYAAFLATLAPFPVEVGSVVFLPLGLSFFTFEAIAYLVDVKRGTTVVEGSVLRVALYTTLFPHLVSGPIMRPNDLFPQLRREIVARAPAIASGLMLFTEGLLKKRIADLCGVVADRGFASPDTGGTAAAWAAALAYTVQIYGDFAGYTDMGRGVARLLGLELPVNFALPYAARTVTDFWRRWHISLSSWLRDYLYIGLGGNRRGRIRTYVNVMVTMLLGGLWHGAGWTFIAWGGYHGILLSLERAFGWHDHAPKVAGTVIALFLVVNGWVLFRSRDFGIALAMFHAMYVPRGGELVSGARGSLFALGAFAVLVAVMIVQRERPRAFDRLR